MIIELKVWPLYFEALKNGDKTFEVRAIDDRQFKYGDHLILMEWDPNRYFPKPNDPEADERARMAAYTGRRIHRVVTYVLVEGLVWKGKPAAVLGLGEFRA